MSELSELLERNHFRHRCSICNATETERDTVIAERTEARAEAFRANRRADEYMADLRAIAAHLKCNQSVEAVNKTYDAAQERARELEAEVERCKKLIERDRTGMAAALNEIRKVAIGYVWIPNGELGCYTAAGCGEGEELTEDVLRAEVGRCLDAIRGLAVRALAASGDCVNEMFATKRREGK